MAVVSAGEAQAPTPLEKVAVVGVNSGPAKPGSHPVPSVNQRTPMKSEQIQAMIVFILVILGCVGWIMNIVKMAATNDLLTGLFVVRVVGVFVAPLGAVLGYF